MVIISVVVVDDIYVLLRFFLLFFLSFCLKAAISKV